MEFTRETNRARIGRIRFRILKVKSKTSTHTFQMKSLHLDGHFFKDRTHAAHLHSRTCTQPLNRVFRGLLLVIFVSAGRTLCFKDFIHQRNPSHRGLPSPWDCVGHTLHTTTSSRLALSRADRDAHGPSHRVISPVNVHCPPYTSICPFIRPNVHAGPHLAHSLV